MIDLNKMSLETNNNGVINKFSGQISRSMRSLASNYTESYQGLPKIAWMMAVVTLLVASGRMVSIFLVVYLSVGLQLPNIWIGLVAGVYGAGAVIGALVGGRLCQRMSSRRVILVSLIGNGSGFISLYFLGDVYQFTIVLFISSCFESAFRPAAVAVMTNAAEPSERTRRYALYQVALTIGTAASAAAGGLISAIEFSLIFWCGGLMCLLAALYLGFCRWPENDGSWADQEESQTTSVSLWRNPVFLILACVVAVYYMLFFQLYSTYTLYLTREYGFDSSGIGLLFTFFMIINAFSVMFVTDRLKSIDHRYVAALGSLVFCSGLAILPFGNTFSFAFLSMVALAIGSMLFLPAFVELLHTCSGSKRAGEALGIYFSIAAVCRIAAPIVGIWIVEVLGNTILWMICGVSGILAAILLLFLPARSSPLR